jgi:hypothetical protein
MKCTQAYDSFQRPLYEYKESTSMKKSITRKEFLRKLPTPIFLLKAYDYQYIDHSKSLINECLHKGSVQGKHTSLSCYHNLIFHRKKGKEKNYLLE